MTVAHLDTDHSDIQRLDGRLRDLLAGKKIVITGVTGFIGEQLLWKILTELPNTTPAVLVRRKGSASARDRMISLIKKPIFNDLRDAAGGAADLLDSRIEVIEGDLPNVPELPADLDVVVHCAGDVSFDPPIDQALTTNVIGTKALMDRMLQAVCDEKGDPRTVPHYVHVSTAYTAGRRRGAILEAPHVHNIDYDAEAAAGIAMQELIEAESRTSARLAKLRKEAEREHRQAGFLTTAADTERRGVVVVDEAYYEFARVGTPSALVLLPDYPRLAVSRTMSKAFAFAAGRLGYLAAAPAFIEALRIVRLPYHLSALTQAAARVALAHAPEMLAKVDQLRQARDDLAGWLTARGLEVADSDANFVLFGRFADRHAVWQALLDRGVLIRETGPEGWLRVSAGTPAEMRAFKDALTAALTTQSNKEIP